MLVNFQTVLVIVVVFCCLADKETSPLTDLHALFSEPNVLRSVAAKIK